MTFQINETPTDPLALLVEHELELRPAAGVGWECGYFSYEGGADHVLGKGATPAEAIHEAAAAIAP